jgi:hypothetical protein
MLIASAPISASSDSNVELILISAGLVLVVGLAGFAVVRLAIMRGRKKRDTLLAAVIIWGMLTAGSISYSVMQQMNWSTSYQQQLMSGYGNPDDLSDKPQPPVVLWSILGFGYALMLAWANRNG